MDSPFLYGECQSTLKELNGIDRSTITTGSTVVKRTVSRSDCSVAKGSSTECNTFCAWYNIVLFHNAIVFRGY